MEGKSFDELVQQDLDLLAAAGVEETAEGVGGGAVDVERLQAEYLDRMPHGHGSHGYVGRGLYAAQLELLFSVFSVEQVLVLTLDQLKGAEQTQETMASVYDFVGLPPFDILQGDATPKNTRDYVPMADATKARLKEFYAPHNARLYRMLGRDLGWD